MNPESPTPREQLEARLTALLLGELSADEAAALREIMRNDAQLGALHGRLKQTIELLRETAMDQADQAAEPPAPLRLGADRREKMLAQFKTVAPREFAPAEPRRNRKMDLLAIAAVIAVLGLLAGLMLPTLSASKARSISQRSMVINNLRQIDGAKQQWASENKKSLDDVPTMKELLPYMGRGTGETLKPVLGEKYIIGKVGQSPEADVDAKNARKLLGAEAAQKLAGEAIRERIGFSDDGSLALLDDNGLPNPQLRSLSSFQSHSQEADKFRVTDGTPPAMPAARGGNIVLPPPIETASAETGPPALVGNWSLNGTLPAMQLAEKEQPPLNNSPSQEMAKEASPAPVMLSVDTVRPKMAPVAAPATAGEVAQIQNNWAAPVSVAEAGGTVNFANGPTAPTAQAADSYVWQQKMHNSAGNFGLADGSVRQGTTGGFHTYVVRTGDINMPANVLAFDDNSTAPTTPVAHENAALGLQNNTQTTPASGQANGGRGGRGRAPVGFGGGGAGGGGGGFGGSGGTVNNAGIISSAGTVEVNMQTTDLQRRETSVPTVAPSAATADKMQLGDVRAAGELLSRNRAYGITTTAGSSTAASEPAPATPPPTVSAAQYATAENLVLNPTIVFVGADARTVEAKRRTAGSSEMTPQQTAESNNQQQAADNSGSTPPFNQSYPPPVPYVAGAYFGSINGSASSLYDVGSNAQTGQAAASKRPAPGKGAEQLMIPPGATPQPGAQTVALSNGRVTETGKLGVDPKTHETVLITDDEALARQGHVVLQFMGQPTTIDGNPVPTTTQRDVKIVLQNNSSNPGNGSNQGSANRALGFNWFLGSNSVNGSHSIFASEEATDDSLRRKAGTERMSITTGNAPAGTNLADELFYRSELTAQQTAPVVEHTNYLDGNGFMFDTSSNRGVMYADFGFGYNNTPGGDNKALASSNGGLLTAGLREQVNAPINFAHSATQLASVSHSYDAETRSINYVGNDKLVISATNLAVEMDKSATRGPTNKVGVVALYSMLVPGTPTNLVSIGNQIAKEDRPLVKPATPPLEPQPEILVQENAFSTFSLNVSDVSFKLAAASLERGVMPDAGNVRTEEFINAFDYRDPDPAPGVAIGFAWERAHYPFAHNRDLLRFSVKTAAAGRQPGRPLNIVLLLDNSGSMERADRVAIIREALKVLAAQLQPQDTISVVTFARTARLWVDGIRGDQAGQVLETVGGLTPEGGTNLGDALELAYATARRHYLANGVNRVVLLTDGAANLGNVDPAALKQKVEAQRKQGVALDCFGIGWEGYNDDLLEVLTRNGDGRYGFINTPEEAAEGFAGQLAGALHVAASDVKVQVEFNPARVISYRQLGYAKHQLTKEQFRDNTVNAAQIGAAEAGNALYTVEINPQGSGPVGTVRVRYRDPGTADYHEHAWDVPYTGNAVGLEQASPAMRLAATASAFSEWLGQSPFAGDVTPDALLGYLRGVPEVYGADMRPAQLETMIREAKSMTGK